MCHFGTFSVLCCLITTFALVISSSQLELCDGGTELNCAEKLSVQILVQSDSTATETMTFSLSQTLDVDGTNTSFVTPVEGQCYFVDRCQLFGLRYIKSLPGVVEEVVLDGYCDDDDPCDGGEGLCCDCSVLDILFGDNLRSGESCLDLPFASHCLETGGNTYHLFELGSLSKLMTVRCVVGDVTLDVSASDTVAISDDRSVRLELLGTVYGFEETVSADVGDYFVYNPTDADLSLVVPTSLVTEDGSGCDMIGVGFVGFNHGDFCANAMQTCLSNQPDELVSEDLALIAEGGEARYLADRFEGYTPPTGVSEEEWTGTGLRYNVTNDGVTILLTLSADDLSVTTHEVAAVISEISVATEFEAGSSTNVSVTITSLGTQDCLFYVGLPSCSSSVAEVVSQSVTIEGGASAVVEFSIYVLESSAEDLWCECVLESATGTELDRQEFDFETSDLVFDYSQFPENESSFDEFISDLGCACSWYNLLCAYLMDCTGYLILVGLICFFVLFSCCCCCNQCIRLIGCVPCLRCIGYGCCCICGITGKCIKKCCRKPVKRGVNPVFLSVVDLHQDVIEQMLSQFLKGTQKLHEDSSDEESPESQI